MPISRRGLAQWLVAGAVCSPFTAEWASAGGTLRKRMLGRTGLKVSELGFGGAAIGGNSFGSVSEREALDTLAAAHERGCNFIDTARIYGESERVLGKYLRGGRDRYIVASKYSGQQPGMRRTLEEQLTRLGTEAIDVYQVHWVPRGKDVALYEDLYALRKEGKARFIGVSASTSADVDYVLSNLDVDTVQLPFNLLQPEPMLAGLSRLRAAGLGVIARSVLREGFLTGKFARGQVFDPKIDVRGGLDPAQLDQRLDDVAKFDFLRQYDPSMTHAAIRYALSFAGIATSVIGTKTVAQARENFSPMRALPAEALRRIKRAQRSL